MKPHNVPVEKPEPFLRGGLLSDPKHSQSSTVEPWTTQGKGSVCPFPSSSITPFLSRNPGLSGDSSSYSGPYAFDTLDHR